MEAQTGTGAELSRVRAVYAKMYAVLKTKSILMQASSKLQLLILTDRHKMRLPPPQTRAVASELEDYWR